MHWIRVVVHVGGPFTSEFLIQTSVCILLYAGDGCVMALCCSMQQLKLQTLTRSVIEIRVEPATRYSMIAALTR